MPRAGFSGRRHFCRKGRPDLERRIALPEGEIRYEWTRKRVKNYNLRVRTDGSVALSTPFGVSGAEADRFIRERAGWLAAARRRVEWRRPTVSLRAGGAWTLAGRPFGMWVERVPSAAAALWDENTLIMTLPIGLSSEEEEIRLRTLLRQALREPAEREFAALLERYAPLLEEVSGRRNPPPALTVRWMTSRWGSCSPARGRITLNAALVLAPPECAAYVVLHELAHRLHPNHSPAFHALVAALLKRAGLPGEAELRRRLRESDAAALMR